MGISIERIVYSTVGRAMLPPGAASPPDRGATAGGLARDDLIDLVSHEIRAPLANIRAGVELLAATDSLAPQQEEILSLIAAETARLADFVEGMLDLRSADRNGASFAREPVNLLPLVRDKIATYHRRSAIHTFRISAPGRLPLAWGDETKIDVVLSNLLDNAIKYSPDGGVIAVEIGLPLDESCLEVRVADQGIGIPAESRQKVFDRFCRLKSEGIPQPPGRGLGLYITRKLVEGQGGHIWVADTEGPGTCIAFTIPRLMETQLMEEADEDVERRFGDAGPQGVGRGRRHDDGQVAADGAARPGLSDAIGHLWEGSAAAGVRAPA